MSQTAPSNWDGAYAPVVLGGSIPAAVPIPETREILKPPERFAVLGVNFSNVTRTQAIELLDEALCSRKGRARSVFYANAHTLNLAAADPSYRDVLNAADFVFADGTGVRWAARLQGVRILENMVGTDFIPLLLEETSGRGHSYFLLGASAKTIAAGATYARRTFPGWTQAGYHHGYLTADRTGSGRYRRD